MPSTIRIRVYVQPRAARNEIAGRHGGEVKIRLAAPPVDNAANEELLTFVSQKLGIRRREVRLVAGATSRHKLLEIDGLGAQEVADRLT